MSNSSHQIRLFRFVRDAWEDGLRQWLQLHADACLRGEEVWLVVADSAQANWLKFQAALEDIALLGVKFLTAGGLRRELCRLLRVPTRTLGRESLEFLLKLEALRQTGREASSVALSPGTCLQALNELGHAGWSGDEADIGAIPSPVQDWLRVLADSGAWTPAIDRQLRDAAAAAGTQPVHLCLWAWDAEFQAESMLLTAALSVVQSANLYLPLALTTPDMEWVQVLEQTCSAEATVCAASDFASVNESLVDRLARPGEAEAGGALPLMLVGEREADQLALLERLVMKWLPDCGPADRIGVVFPSNSPQAWLLVERLTALGIPILDEAGRRQTADLATAVQQKLVRYYAQGRLVDDFLALMTTASQFPGSTPAWQAIPLRRLLHRLFAQHPTAVLPDLLAGMDPTQEKGHEIADLVKKLGDWPKQATWEQLKEKWLQAVAVFGGNTENLEPLWSRLDSVLAGREIPGKAFLDYLAGLLTPVHFVSDTGARQAFAKVVVTTLDRAQYQGWKHLILAEANEGRWPVPIQENPFLPDLLKQELNRQRGKQQGRLLTTTERTQLAQKRLQDLLENCSGQLALSAVAYHAEKPEQGLYPNELFLQLLMMTDEEQAVLQRWQQRVQSKVPALSAGPAAAADLPAAEAAHLAAVNRRRRDPQQPFDEYLFCYPGQAREGEKWAVTRLESLATCPATTALELLFQAVGAEQEKFQRSEKWFVGVLLHEWMRRYFADNIPAGNLLEQRIGQIGEELRQDFRLPQSLWWNTTFATAAWAVRGCLRTLYQEGLEQWALAQPEVSMEGVVMLPTGNIGLRGRMDLVLRDRPDHDARLKIIDFKTSRMELPSLRRLASGEGLQFGAYLLLADQAGAAQVEVQCLSPRATSDRRLTREDLLTAQQGLALAAFRQQTLQFGMQIAADDYKRGEQLPLATVPIEREILAAKEQLSFGQSLPKTGEGEDEGAV